MITENEARDFAFEAHANEKYGDLPYTKHLTDVVNIIKSDVLPLIAFKWYDKSLIVAAGYLHDAMEDVNVSWNDLKFRFNSELADLVYLVTDEPGENRKEKKRKTYPKIFSGGARRDRWSSDRPRPRAVRSPTCCPPASSRA